MSEDKTIGDTLISLQNQIDNLKMIVNNTNRVIKELHPNNDLNLKLFGYHTTTNNKSMNIIELDNYSMIGDLHSLEKIIELNSENFDIETLSIKAGPIAMARFEMFSSFNYVSKTLGLLGVNIPITINFEIGRHVFIMKDATTSMMFQIVNKKLGEFTIIDRHE